jgi:transcriptional regulator with XRE-family HTH domain
MCKLSIEDIKDVKMMLIYSGLTQKEIARFKGCSVAMISFIKLGECHENIDID